MKYIPKLCMTSMCTYINGFYTLSGKLSSLISFLEDYEVLQYKHLVNVMEVSV